MTNLNKNILIGRLTTTPELKHTTSNIPVTSFTIAINRKSKQGEEKIADFIDVVAWRGTAEFVCKHFCKGQAIFIEGTIQTRNWQDKEGKNRKATEVVAIQVDFAEPKKADVNENQLNVSANQDDFQEISEEDELPF